MINDYTLKRKVYNEEVYNRGRRRKIRQTID